MYKSRFNEQVPHHHDTQLLERCQEQLRDYDIYYKGWTEPRDHTISYLAAAYIELAGKFEALTTPAAETFEQSVFEAQMNNSFSEELAEQMLTEDEEIKL